MKQNDEQIFLKMEKGKNVHFLFFENSPNFQNFFRVPCLPSQFFLAKATKFQKIIIPNVPWNCPFTMTARTIRNKYY